MDTLNQKDTKKGDYNCNDEIGLDIDCTTNSSRKYSYSLVPPPRSLDSFFENVYDPHFFDSRINSYVMENPITAIVYELGKRQLHLRAFTEAMHGMGFTDYDASKAFYLSALINRRLVTSSPLIMSSEQVNCLGETVMSQSSNENNNFTFYNHDVFGKTLSFGFTQNVREGFIIDFPVLGIDASLLIEVKQLTQNNQQLENDFYRMTRYLWQMTTLSCHDHIHGMSLDFQMENEQLQDQAVAEYIAEEHRRVNQSTSFSNNENQARLAQGTTFFRLDESNPRIKERIDTQMQDYILLAKNLYEAGLSDSSTLYLLYIGIEQSRQVTDFTNPIDYSTESVLTFLSEHFDDSTIIRPLLKKYGSDQDSNFISFAREITYRITPSNPPMDVMFKDINVDTAHPSYVYHQLSKLYQIYKSLLNYPELTDMNNPQIQQNIEFDINTLFNNTRLPWTCRVPFSSPIESAIDYGDFELVRDLVEQNKSKFEINDLFRRAVIKGDLRIINFLIEQGADVGCSDNFPIKWAVDNNNFELFEALLNSGIDLSKDEHCLYVACQRGYQNIVDRLLKNNVSLTFAHFSEAIQHNQIDLIDFLLNNYTNQKKTIHRVVDNEQLLTMAVEYNRNEIADMILKGMNEDVSNVLITALYADNEEMYRKLLPLVFQNLQESEKNSLIEDMLFPQLSGHNENRWFYESIIDLGYSTVESISLAKSYQCQALTAVLVEKSVINLREDYDALLLLVGYSDFESIREFLPTISEVKENLKFDLLQKAIESNHTEWIKFLTSGANLDGGYEDLLIDAAIHCSSENLSFVINAFSLGNGQSEKQNEVNQEIWNEVAFYAQKYLGHMETEKIISIIPEANKPDKVHSVSGIVVFQNFNQLKKTVPDTESLKYVDIKAVLGCIASLKYKAIHYLINLGIKFSQEEVREMQKIADENNAYEISKLFRSRFQLD